MAENPSVLQPRLEPDVMSLRPTRPPPYSQGLRKPSGALPFESRKSLEIMPAAACKLGVSWLVEDERCRTEEGGGGKTHRC